MIKRSYLFAAAIALLYVTVAAAQHPILDACRQQGSREIPVVHLPAVDAAESPETAPVTRGAESHGDAAH